MRMVRERIYEIFGKEVMKKLTKEQRDSILEKFHWEASLSERAPAAYRELLENILDRHTEKEFPVWTPANAPIHIGYAQSYARDFIKITILDDGFVNCSKYLNVEEFKQFAIGVNKIVEYLNESEV